MRNFWKDGNVADCCGCGACEHICPKQCISLKPNDEGFLIPCRIDSLCINCGLCEKICPVSDNYTFNTTKPPIVYAAYDREHRVGSSSGGIFVTLAKYVIEKRHGWVYGAAFDKQFQLKHIGVCEVEELEKLRGSKYIQSNIGSTYTEIKRRLTQNEYVMFVGTPCQVAGLRSYLRKEYNNLLLVDLVCHGVPPQALFDEHVKYLECKHHARLVSYLFRDPDGWGVCEICDFANPQKHKVLPTYSLSPYLNAFMQAYTYRDSCYECKFAQIPRQGDITLADFWGVSNFFPEIKAKEGVSLVLANTPYGDTCLKETLKDCVVYQSNLEDASMYNPNLVSRTKRPKVRDTVFSEIQEKGYESIARTIFRVKNYHLLRMKIWLKSLK